MRAPHTRFPLSARPLVAFAVLAVLAVSATPVRRARAQAMEFPEPQVLRSVDGVLDATLLLDEGTAVIAGRDVPNVWTYHLDGAPHYPGPTLHVQPGDTIRIRYVNRLDTQPTNLHTHGLHVSPLGNSDNVLLKIPPDAENQFVIRVPRDHAHGLYWYHPHVHGTVNPQVYMGLSGLIVVGRADGSPPELDGARQRLLALQYSYVDPSDGALKDAPFNVDRGRAFFSDLANMRFTVNGHENPTLEIRPGEQQVWSFANISNNGYFRLRLRGTGETADQPLYLVAQDGNPFLSPVKLDAGGTLLVPPGARYSALVQGPPAGTYELVMEPHSDGFFQWPPSFGSGGYQQGRPLATVVSGGEAVEPRPVPRRLSPPNNYLKRLDRARVDYRRTAVFNIVFPDPDTVQFVINNGMFPNNPVFQPRLHTVEEWELVNLSDAQHPFHIHVNDFQLQSLFDPADATNRVSQPQLWYQDIVNLPDALAPAAGGVTPSRTVLRINPLRFLGTYVYHCHRVDHEDGGMMAMITIIPETPIYVFGGTSGSRVRVRSGLDNRKIAEFRAFRKADGAVRVAAGDVDHDGVMDVAAAPGPGGGKLVRVFGGTGRFRRVIREIRPFAEAFSGGLNVALGDMDSDGYDDLIVAPAAGGPPEVRVFSGRNGDRIGSFMAYEEGFAGGVNLAAGILRDGGRVSIVTGPGRGRVPDVRVFDVDWYGTLASGRCGCGRAHRVAGAAEERPIVQTSSVTAYDASLRFGVNVATGPIAGMNGGFSAVLTGLQSGALPLVKAFVMPGETDHSSEGHGAHSDGDCCVLAEVASLWAFPPGTRGGVSVATVSTPTGADLIAAAGAGSSLPFRRFRYHPDSGTFQRLDVALAGRGGARGESVGGR